MKIVMKACLIQRQVIATYPEQMSTGCCCILHLFSPLRQAARSSRASAAASRPAAQHQPQTPRAARRLLLHGIHMRRRRARLPASCSALGISDPRVASAVYGDALPRRACPAGLCCMPQPTRRARDVGGRRNRCVCSWGALGGTHATACGGPQFQKWLSEAFL